jgi:chromosomal replication initiation ATPase DnaA
MKTYEIIPKCHQEKQRLERDAEHLPELQAIMAEVATILNVDEEELMTGVKTAIIVAARRIFYHAAKLKNPNYSYRLLATVSGLTNHSSPITGLQKVSELLKVKEPIFMKLLSYYIENTKLFTKSHFE